LAPLNPFKMENRKTENQRKNIIVLTRGDEIETWGSLAELCRYHPDFSYYYLKRQEYPFNYKGVLFRRVPFRQQNGV
jgi:hypothetical protein